MARAFLLLAALLISFSSPPSAASANHDIPAVFAFGDSTLDPGNNNGMATLARANHAPYGCDFPGGAATGRFSNGKLITDYIVESLGIKALLPAHRDAAGLGVAELSTGVSFASGGSGIDDLTAHTAMVSTFASQISDFHGLLGRIGAPKASEIASRSLYVFSTGTNDVATTYFILRARVKAFPTFELYTAFLMDKLQDYIKTLYSMGARKFIVAGLPPLGCLPVNKGLNMGSKGCVADLNVAAERYNVSLRQTLAKLQAASPGATVAYVDVYTPLMDMVTQPQKYGFTETGKGCCGDGIPAAGVLCNRMVPRCQTPAHYMFFDTAHPSQATYKALADLIIHSHIPKFIK
nr:unnamed protein product [Digitaria exilis]